ncbi:MAG: DNA repair protein RadA [Clostridia bacterium]|nr:DNA repair protein RadA [Clostridia bacterium]
MKQKTVYICSECGYNSPKWLGKCPTCSNWNTFNEEPEIQSSRYDIITDKNSNIKQHPRKLYDISEENETRISSKMHELDRVLGGGIVKGSLILVGGDPGIGKSTLLLQISDKIANDNNVLYVSGEESLQQIKIRATRLGANGSGLYILPETDLDCILTAASESKPTVMIIDSIQTIFKSDIPSAPGSVTQVREVTHYLMRFAKENNITVFIVGHVTKDGNIAGPRMLEHMVDCVLYFEGERTQSYRILRTVKNRFGSTNEIGVFEMKDNGLAEVKNPSQMLLEGRPENVSGSTVVCTLEGTRPILAEVQALCSPTGFGNPRRMATGIDFSRAVLLTAILEKQLGYPMQNHDVYINVVGGIKIIETATDLAVIVAIASNIKNFVIDSKTIILGEVGLTSEVRSIGYCEQRINEAAKMGFEYCIVPSNNLQSIKQRDDIKLLPVKNVSEAIRYLKKIEDKRNKDIQNQ